MQRCVLHMVHLVVLGLIACDPGPTSTGTRCDDPDPLTLAYATADVSTCVASGDDGDCGFGKRFMDAYCIQCHDSKLSRSMRNGAPLFHDFETLLGVLKTPDHIDQQAGSGPDASNHFMPPGRCPTVAGGPLDRDCPQPTTAERQKLAKWIACERDREHAF